jgi:hypothetical protein
MTFKVERLAGKRRTVVLRLCGHIAAEHVGTIEELVGRESDRVALDLSEITLVERDVVRCLARYVLRGVELRNCPPFIQEWVDKENSL